MTREQAQKKTDQMGREKHHNAEQKFLGVRRLVGTLKEMVKVELKVLENEYDSTSRKDGNPLEFSITILASLGTILYLVYNFVQTNPINNIHYKIILSIVSPIIVFMIGNILYIFSKGYSMGMINNNTKKTINIISSQIFSLNFPIVLMYLAVIIYFLTPFIVKTWVLLIPIFVTFLVIYVLGIILFKKMAVEHNKPFSFFTIFILVFLLWFPTFHIINNSSLLQGHIAMDMGDIYSRNDTQIPVPIKITGPNTNLYIKLNNVSQNESREKTWYLALSPGPINNYNESDDKSLTGYALGNGEYIVYIDTTSLPTGYYKLNCTRPDYKQSYTAKGFYLSES